MTLCVSLHWMIMTYTVDYGSFIPLHDALRAYMFLCVCIHLNLLIMCVCFLCAYTCSVLDETI